MLPVARANLDHICCICLLDVRASVVTQKVYNVKKERNISKMLRLTAQITILKNPINQKYVDDYCRKICETCYIKIQYSYNFREKIIASATTLKELLQNNLNEMDIEKLKYFCRICLNRQKDIKRLEVMHMNWLKECSGIRFTSYIDKEVFRIKEGININEIAIIDDAYFPQNLCRCCLKQLKNVDEFRKSATQSFEYMISLMGDSVSQEYHLYSSESINVEQNVCKNVKQIELEVLNHKQDEWNSEVSNIKERKQDRLLTDLIQNPNFSFDAEPLITADGFINKNQFESNAMGFMDSICNCSDSSEQRSNSNLCLIESTASNKSDDDSPRKGRIKKSEQEEINEKQYEIKNEMSKEEIIESTVVINSSKIPKEKTRGYAHKLSSMSLRNLNENKEQTKITMLKNADNKTKQTMICEECSKEFASNRSLRKHKQTVHNFDSNKMLECMICLKKFKRKSHMEDHIKSVHEKLKPFNCSYCPKTFTAKSTRRVHELGHTGDFPFICNICGKGFRRPYQLKTHLDIHTAIPELLCPICKRSQASKTDLETHLQIHSDKRVQCPLCGKIFSRNSHFRDHHNAVHLKLRPFKCKYCELAFGDRRTLRKHEKRHTVELPLKCSICSMGFKTQTGLKRHMQEFDHISEHS